MSNLFKKAEKFVDEKRGKKSKHFERAVYWVKQLKPDADEALLIAAYSHDVDRLIHGENRGAFLLKPESLKEHQERGGQAMHDFLIKAGADKNLANKVKKLIEKHEDGGNEEQNILKDADSISYFETNANNHVEWTDKFTKAQIRAKLDYMFNRITFDKARDSARPMYDDAINKLENKK